MPPEARSPGRADGHPPTVVKRVSRKAHDEFHGGAWKVAFADFCLALLCLFLVMWLLASRNAERMQVVLQSAGSNLLEDGNGVTNALTSGSRGSLLERHPVPAWGATRSEGPMRNATQSGSDTGAAAPARQRFDSSAALQALAREIQRISAEEGLDGNLKAAITPQGLRLMLHDTDARGMFERGSALPSLRFRTLLRKLGPVFAQIDNQLIVVGHTDAVPYSEAAPGAFSNWGLSTQRAMAARFHLLEGGMPQDSVMQVSGMADSTPLNLDNPRAAENRRIELMVLTSAQAALMSTLFGAPRQPVSLGDGMGALLAETPEDSRALRKILQPAADK